MNKKIVVLGGGESGVGAAILAKDKGMDVFLSDYGKIAPHYKQQLIDEGIAWEEGGHDESRILAADEVIKSPGIAPTAPIMVKIAERGIPVISEIEFAGRYTDAKMVCITGSNGKTTTTLLTYHILKNAGINVGLAGNVGRSLALQVAREHHDVYVIELSSFQLETVLTFRPRVSAILNFTPDHLNRHHTMEAYVNAKKNIAKNKTGEDYCILNYEDKLTREFGENIEAQVLYFSSRRKLEQGIYLEDGEIIYRNGKEISVCRVEELNLLGTHNYENVMAASAMALVYGVPADIVRACVKAFKGVEHRIEYVAKKDGVVYYNDSKGTNPDAAIKGIQAMNRPTVLIGGGYDKDSVYTEWIRSFDGKVKKLILLGETKEKIAREARECGFEDYVFAETFEEAVLEAARTAKPGEAVLLSPACASWDMFPSYEVRGEKFKEIVNSL